MDEAGAIQVRERTPDDAAWIEAELRAGWGSTQVVSRGRLWDAAALDGLVAERGGRPVALLTWRIEGDAMEVVTMQSMRRRVGAGRALLSAAVEHARLRGCGRVWLVTTNDNRTAQAFYESAGMRRAAVHRGALERSRQLKPSIPATGEDGTPIEDEFEYELVLR